MSTDILKQIEADKAALLREKDEVTARAAQIDVEIQELVSAEKVVAKVVARYGHSLSTSDSTTSAARPVVVAGIRKSNRREQIFSKALELLPSGALLTERLVDALEEDGVAVPGDDRKAKIRNLSSYLSRAQQELNIRPSRQGWVVAPQQGAIQNQKPATEDLDDLGLPN